MNKPLDKSGFTLPTVLAFILVVAILSGFLLQVILTNFTMVGNQVDRQKAFNIAEAGVNYYLWHLAHNAGDFKDGKSTPTSPDPVLGYGPYEHQYIDDNAKNSGTYTLWINPQGNGSTVATVRSIGKVNGTNITRTVEAKIGASSFASYGLSSDSAFWFGNTESADGPVHSNQGIRMDGASNSDVTSANDEYTPPYSLGGDGNQHPGVWCHSSVTSPVDCDTRSKVDWHYPVPLVDFNQVSGSLCTIKKEAFSADASTSSYANQPNACNLTPNIRTDSYIPQRYTNGSFNIARGYLIQLNTNGTYDLYRVNGENDRQTPYTNALTRQLVESNITVPSNGVIFAEDNVWVRTNPTFAGRVTIAAGRLATSRSANIVIADDVAYSTKNGSDSIGLIAEDSILIAPYAPPSTGSFSFEVNAALLAQTGSVEYPNRYRTDQYRCTRGWVNNNQNFVFYGSVASRQTWTWTWQMGGSCGDAVYSNGYYRSGIYHNTTTYDNNLLFAPPPSYPITAGYNILSWREVLTTP